MEMSASHYPARMHRGEVIGLSVVVTTNIARSQHLGTWAAHKHNQSVKSATNWVEYTLNRLAQCTNITNGILLLAIVATPMDHAHYALCMYFLLMRTTGLIGVGKGCRRHIPSCIIMRLMPGVHGVCALRGLVFTLCTSLVLCFSWGYNY